MLLAIDVGNTNTVLGVFEGKHLRAQWRLSTNRGQTADEYGILIRNLFSLDGIPAEALFQRAARLPRVEIREPQKAIGTNTVSSMQSGLFYGAVGAVDGILDRLSAALGGRPKIVATGGQASLIAAASKYHPPVDPSLTLEGLRID